MTINAINNTSKEDVASAAERAIISFENSPNGFLMRSTVEPLIKSLGGSIEAIECSEHAGSICLYVAALLIRNGSTK